MDPGPPTSWPRLPSAGESFGRAWEPLGDLTVEDGSRLAGPIYGGDDFVDARLALLEVIGDPATVLEAYRAQLVRELEFGTVRPVEHFDIEPATTLDIVTASEAGGRGFTLELVQRTGEPALLAITAGQD